MDLVLNKGVLTMMEVRRRKFITHFVNILGNLTVSSTSLRNDQSTLSYAFSWSRNNNVPFVPLDSVMLFTKWMLSHMNLLGMNPYWLSDMILYVIMPILDAIILENILESVFVRSIGLQFLMSSRSPFLNNVIMNAEPLSGIGVPEVRMWLKRFTSWGANFALFLLYISYGIPSGPGDLRFGRIRMVSSTVFRVMGVMIDSYSVWSIRGGNSSPGLFFESLG